MKRLFMPGWALLALSLCFCQANNDPDTRAWSAFSTSAWVNDLARNGQGLTLVKETNRRGAHQETTLKNPDLARELALFKLADIGKLAWQGLFTKTSTHVNGSTVEQFQSTSPRTQVKWAQVWYDAKGRVERYSFRMQDENYLFDVFSSGIIEAAHTGTEPRLKRFKLEGKQKMRFGQDFDYAIEGRAL